MTWPFVVLINEIEHDTNLARFKELIEKYGLTLNENKCLQSN